ncbi:AMP-binding protein [Aerococcus viridans]|uniref:AMP-binding protein n=1 Tax=Aerococcus viridans TaxID=1377 RepID=UPI0039B0D9E7
MHLNLEKIESKRIAIIDDFRSITYGELIDEANSFASNFKKSDLVFQIADNSIDSFVAHYGLVNNGIVSLILSHEINQDLLQNLVEIYSPNYIVTRNNESNIKYSNYEFTQIGNHTVYSLHNELININSQVEFLMSTSGSTGSPKLVKYKKGNLTTNAINVSKSFEWTENEVSLCSLPLNYTMGLNVINSQLVVGAKVVLTNHNVVSLEHWNLIDKYQITNFTGVPFSYEVMKKFRIFNKELPSLKTLCSGGGKLTSQLFKDIAEYTAKHGKRFISSFGTTETSARMMMLDPKLVFEKNQSIGKPINGGRAELITDNGNIINEADTPGELVYYGPNVTLGYATNKMELNLPDEFKGEYHTGDIAIRDNEGFYYIKGRLKRFIKITGNRIGLDEVENFVSSQFNIPVAVTGEDENLQVFIEDEKLSEEIRAYISEKIDISILSITVNIITNIPRNESGKIKYKDLEW